MSKVLEKVAVSQMMDFLERTGRLPPRQHGFRRGRSTITSVASAHAAWKSTAMKSKGKQFLAVAAFDLSAAFDTVSLDALRTELISLGFTSAAIQWVDSYMRGGQQLVDWNGARSKPLSVQYGVRQGSIAGPLFFLIVTRNLAAIFEAASVYADDTTAWFAADSWEALAISIEVQSAR